MITADVPQRLTEILIAVLPWMVVAMLTLNMSQRWFMHVGVGKRFATLQLAGLVAALWGAALFFGRFGVSDLFLVPVLGLLAAVAVVRRRSIFPHRLRCASCGARLPIKRILYHDDARCASCAQEDK
jgi:hypothetical protein